MNKRNTQQRRRATVEHLQQAGEVSVDAANNMPPAKLRFGI